MDRAILTKIRAAVTRGEYRITTHADLEMAADELILEEVKISLKEGEIIEDYPEDFPFPSCLIYGRSYEGGPVHSVWAYDEANEFAILVTVYRPDPSKWIDFKIRR